MFQRYRKRHPGSSLARLWFFDLCRETVLWYFRVFHRLRRIDVMNIPREGPVLLVANHQSFYDPPAIGGGVRHRHSDFLARSSLFKFKPFGWLISTLNSTPIKQGSGDAGAMKATIQKMKNGRMMLVFPEGSRTPDGEMQPFQRGAAVLLKRAHCQVVPVGIAGAFEAWPRSRKLPIPFRDKIVVCYGEPISSDEIMKESAEEALAHLRERVDSLRQRAESLR
jgi:1-acyl-sn-glycerol-3-phosphate acyltransferase